MWSFLVHELIKRQFLCQDWRKMRRRDRKTTSHMSVGWRLWRLKPKCQCVIYSWCLSLISPEDVPPRASPDLHPQHTHQLSSHNIFPFYSSSFLVGKEQALPGGMRLFLTFTSLVRYPSIRLSLSCTCAFSFVSLQVSLPFLYSSPPAHGPESSFVYFFYPRPPPSSQFVLFWSHQDQRRWDEKKEVRKEGRYERKKTGGKK